LKTVDPKGPGVRIPLSPPVIFLNADWTTVSAFLLFMRGKKGANIN
jgi:hypothetical protein